MARPEKNTVEYFPFFCEDGNKMFYIEETYGNDGFATFIKLLRELAKTNFHYLDLSKPTTQMFLSAKCKVSKETLLCIINDLVELGKFDKILWVENQIIWCQDFVDSIQDAYIKRKNKCITYSGLLQHLVSLGVRKPMFPPKKDDNNTQTKLNYTKLNNNKEIVDEIKSIFEQFKKEVKSHNFDSQIEGLYRILKIKNGSLNTPLQDYQSHLITELRIHKNTQEFFKNFKNWLNVQDRLGKLDIYKNKT